MMLIWADLIHLRHFLTQFKLNQIHSEECKTAAIKITTEQAVELTEIQEYAFYKYSLLNNFDS